LVDFFHASSDDIGEEEEAMDTQFEGFATLAIPNNMRTQASLANKKKRERKQMANANKPSAALDGLTPKEYRLKVRPHARPPARSSACPHSHACSMPDRLATVLPDLDELTA